MRARTQPGRTKPYEYYACDGRFSGSTACTEPVIPREEIDRAIWRSFETVGLDHQAMEREHEERRSLELIDLADRVAEAEREVATAAERIERVEGDYLAGELSADRYERLLDRCESERDAAAAALDQLRGREQELREAERLRDAEEDVLRELQAIREALAGFITGAGDLEGARAALRRVFESFTFHRYGSTRPGVLDADLASGDWYIVLAVRTDAILSPLVAGRDKKGEPTVEQDQRVRRTTLSTCSEKLSPSPRRRTGRSRGQRAQRPGRRSHRARRARR
jgi:hypothetical protein